MTHPWPKQVKIVEVGPRDGLQAEKEILSVEDRVRFINLLSQAGYDSIEVGSFVSPEWIPQMAGSDEVYQQIEKKAGIDYSVLIPNHQGFNRAQELGITSLAVFTAASETFCQRNINCSIEESYNRFAEFLPQARASGMRLRGYVSCAIACPYEGEMSPQRVANVVNTLLNLGCDEISLGDTIGVGTPAQVIALLDTISAPVEKLAVHFHDTYGQALANIYAALEKGVSIVDASASGLGGCPYAPGASGNVATEDVLYMLQGLGVQSSIGVKDVIKASIFINEKLGRTTGSRAAQAYISQS